MNSKSLTLLIYSTKLNLKILQGHLEPLGLSEYEVLTLALKCHDSQI